MILNKTSYTDLCLEYVCNHQLVYFCFVVWFHSVLCECTYADSQASILDAYVQSFTEMWLHHDLPPCLIRINCIILQSALRNKLFGNAFKPLCVIICFICWVWNFLMECRRVCVCGMVRGFRKGRGKGISQDRKGTVGWTDETLEMTA